MIMGVGLYVHDGDVQPDQEDQLSRVQLPNVQEQYLDLLRV